MYLVFSAVFLLQVMYFDFLLFIFRHIFTVSFLSLVTIAVSAAYAINCTDIFIIVPLFSVFTSVELLFSTHYLQSIGLFFSFLFPIKFLNVVVKIIIVLTFIEYLIHVSCFAHLCNRPPYFLSFFLVHCLL